MSQPTAAPRGPVLVTGAARGLGEAIAVALAEAGIEPILLGRSLASLGDCAAKIRVIMGRAPRCAAADVADWHGLVAAIDGVLDADELLGGVVNNAGVIDPIVRVEDAHPAAWAQCIAVNLVGAFHVLRAGLPRLGEQGVIANISSGAAQAEHAGWSAYAASKAGLERLSATLAAERPDLTVVAVRPGVTDTGMQAEIRHSGIDNAIRKLRREDLQPPEVPARAIAALFLADWTSPPDRVVETRSTT